MAEITGTHLRAFAALAAAAGDEDHALLGARGRAAMITVHPGAGGTASVAISSRPHEDIEAGNASWVEVDMGGMTEVSVASGVELPAAATGVRLSAQSAAAQAYYTATAK